MQKLTFFLATLAALALGGCGQPTQVEGGSKSATNAGVSLTAKFLRKFGYTKDAKATVSFPAAGMIIDALFTPAEANRYATVWRGLEPADPAGAAKDLRQIGSGELDASGKFDMAATAKVVRARIVAMQKAGEPVPAEFLATENSDAALAKIARLNVLRIPLAIPFHPYRGWEIPVYMGFGRPSQQQQATMNTYLAIQEACSQYAAQVLSQIAGQMTTQAWRDPAQATAEIRKIYFSMDPDTLRSAWLTDWKSAEQSTARTINLSGGGQGSVEWSSVAGSFSGRPGGLLWERDGQPWLGDGYIAGKKYEIGLASSMNQGMEKSVDTAGKTDATTGGDSSGKSKVQ